MAAAGDLGGDEDFQFEIQHSDSWQGGQDWRTVEGGPDSGELVDVSQMTTGVLIRTEQLHAVQNSRTLREQHHATRLAACHEDLAAVQRVMYETAEHLASLYSRWIVLHVTMAPDLPQIARMRAGQREMEERLRDLGSLRMRYEYIAQEAEQHEIALRAFDRHRRTTGQPGAGQ